MASNKRLKTDTDTEESIFDRFSKSSVHEQLNIAFEKLCKTPAGALGSLTIRYCNANRGFGQHGKSFSKADVEVIPNMAKQDTAFYFGTVFLKGYTMLKNYLEDPKVIPTGHNMDLILSKLLEYLLSKEKEEFFCNLAKGVTGECELAVRFAEHFFSKLSIASNYRNYQLDMYYPGKTNKCSCCNLNVQDHYGDTSIGNVKVWHGCLDIILGNSPLPIKVEPSPEPDSLGGKDAAELKNGDLEHPDVQSQLLAQTIVFSFAQKKNHPEYSNFLIPSVGVSKDSIIFYFYDCEHDILLRSMTIPFLLQNPTSEDNLQAVLAAWFVVNYKYLGTGCTDEIKDINKANFFALAGPLLSIYQNELTVGGIPHNLSLPIKRFAPIFSSVKYGKSPDEYL